MIKELQKEEEYLASGQASQDHPNATSTRNFDNVVWRGITGQPVTTNVVRARASEDTREDPYTNGTDGPNSRRGEQRRF